ncbi:MAG: cell division protein FtsA [Candidatus Dependentiae bacterium]|nr:cell division protein FtsA [Candidatus Dependentiae bacterium]
MARIFNDRIIVSIDVGTTKMCVLVAHQLDGDRFEIIGVGRAPSEGLRKGVVVDVSKAVRSIRQAVKEAELMAGVMIESAYVGISGGHILSINSHGVVPIKRGQIDYGDIERALAAAQAVPIEQDHQILHVLPQYFVIDARDKVMAPIGMHGIRLEVQAHIVMGAVASVQNLVHCCQMAGVKVKDIILEQLASADAVLSKDERELGVAVLDIGGGTSDLALYQHGSIRHTMVLPVAGNHFTNDVAIGLRTTLGEAERIKKEYGHTLFDVLEKDELIEIEMVHGNDSQIVRVSNLTHILRPRAQELLRLVYEEIAKRQLFPFMPAGLVLTGGGSLLRGMQESAESLFNIPVRIGRPQVEFDSPNSLYSPIYATGYGLLVHALKKQAGSFGQVSGPVYKRVLASMKSWVADFF